MGRTILLAIFCLFAAAWLGPLFTAILLADPLQEFFTDTASSFFLRVFNLSGLGLDDFSVQNPWLYVNLIGWAFVLFVLIRLLTAPVANLLTGLGNFAEQKLARRAQWVLFWLIVLILPTLMVFLVQFFDNRRNEVAELNERLTRLEAPPTPFGQPDFRVPGAGPLGELPQSEFERNQFFRELQQLKIDSLNQLRAKTREELRAILTPSPEQRLSNAYQATVDRLWWILLATAVFFYFVLFGLLYLSRHITQFRMFIDARKLGRGGAARFAGYIEESGQKFEEGNSAIFYGRSLYSPLLNIGSRDERHMLTFGGSRSGKGASCIIPNLLTWPDSAFVIDPKGTAANVTAERRKELGNDVIVVDPFKVTKQKRASFNPLADLNPSSLTIMEEIGQITDALIVSGRKEDSHWTDSAKSMIGGYIAQAISDQIHKNPSLLTVAEMLSAEPAIADQLHARMSRNDAVGGMAKRAASRILTTAEKELSSIRSTALEQTYWLSSLAMRSTLATSSFDFHTAFKAGRKTTVFLVIPPQFLDVHKRFLRLFVNMALMRFPMGGKAPYPCLFIIDEAHSLGRMSQIAKAYGLLASYNLIVWSFFQDKGQLDELYGAEGGTFIANSRAVQAFAVTDETTAKFISERLGKRALTQSFLRSSESVDLRTPSDVRSDIAKETGRQYILQADGQPLLIERQFYYKTRWLRSKAGTDPDFG